MKRGRYEITRDVLIACDQPDVRGMAVANRCGLNWKTAAKYLDMLLEKDMIVVDADYFRITSKGSEMLNKLEKVIM